MKKKLMAVLLGTVMVLSLAACGSSKADFTDDDLVFKGPREVKLELGYDFYTGSDYAVYENLYVFDDWKEYDADFATARGLEIGMTLDDYKELYAVKNGYAMWELRDMEDDGSYMSQSARYTNESAADIYDAYSETDQAWLFLGWCKEDGKWRVMTDEEVGDVWYCYAGYSDFGEVVLLSVVFYYDGEIAAMDMYHFSYDKDWAEWQAWE